ncbi:DNA-J chaperone, putative [Bodo saltans]|uniref:DNA-J chaperone, putative n=1 Tax=Bodo saltans TaxID=75058 RepID=A0A0S4JNU9_BODSA|nr:DNA-J chaperone, putative [Bodo saltans]|eukprot:CUG91826.1 DNA-J chaperone, putative [Bodo saltans]
MDWYRILRVDATATQKEIREAFKTMALLTHPDKKHDVPSPSPSSSRNQSEVSLPTFVDVREAAGVLLDPLQRALFDGQRVHQLVRTEGRISSSLDDQDISDITFDEDSSTFWAVVECRCGGEYRVLLSHAPKGGRYVCECESCSLVVELTVSDECMRSAAPAL